MLEMHYNPAQNPHNTKILGVFKPTKPTRLACALFMSVFTYALLRYTEKMPYRVTKLLSRPIPSLIGAAGAARITYTKTHPKSLSKPTSKTTRFAFTLLMGGLTYALLRSTEGMPYRFADALSRPTVAFMGAGAALNLTYIYTNPNLHNKPASKVNRITFALCMFGLNYALLRSTEGMPYRITDALSRPIISLVGAAAAARFAYILTAAPNPKKPPKKPLLRQHSDDSGEDSYNNSSGREPSPNRSPNWQYVPPVQPKPSAPSSNSASSAVPSAPPVENNKSITFETLKALKEQLITEQKDIASFWVGASSKSQTFENQLSTFNSIVTELSSTLNNVEEETIEEDHYRFIQKASKLALQFSTELKGVIADHLAKAAQSDVDDVSFTISQKRLKTILEINIEYACNCLDIYDPTKKHTQVTFKVNEDGSVKLQYLEKQRAFKVDLDAFTIKSNQVDIKADIVIANNEAIKVLIKELVKSN